MTCKKRSELGFTVIELLTVVGIMMVIMAIATPSFYYWLPTYRLSAGARQIAAELQLSRMKAISQNTTYRLNILAGGTQFQREKDAGFTLDGGPFTLPDGITASPVGPTSVFQSRGTASATDIITVSNGDASRVICVKTVGRVHVEETSC
jgi:Tfp pilus assembly protein FimT